MLTLLAECHFWTNNNDININDNDFGAFKYYTKKDYHNNIEQQNNILGQIKKEYHENRNGIYIIKNDKELRLKDNLRKLDDLIKTNKIIKSEWKDSCIIQILLSNGILVYICVNRMTGDILNMKFDKYFVGKLASETITDAIFSHENILLAYNTNQLTLVNLQKPNYRKCPEKISNMEPKIYHILLPGQAEKKIQRHLLINNNFDLIVVWTKSSQNEIFPWRPTVEDQEHSNMHVFKLKSGKLETIGYCWTENDPIYTQFLMKNNGKILTIEQKVSRKGDITAEICFYIIGSKSRKLSRTGVKTISIRTQICCCSLSPDEEKLLIGTIDQFIYINNLLRSTTKISMKTDIIPTQCVWHPDSTILIIGNDRSQFQCYDFALNTISIKLPNNNKIPSNLLDLSNYFLTQTNLMNIIFSKKPDLNNLTEFYAEQTDYFLMLLYDNGPIVCMKFISNTGILSDINNCGLTFDIICNQYLINNQLENCVKLLCSTNWEIYGSMCLLTLQRITNYVLTQIDQPEKQQTYRILLMQAIESFTNDLNEDVRDKFSDAIIDLKRKLFFFLLRHDLYQDCFELAQNIEEYDLFMDLYNRTKYDSQLIDFSNESYQQAKLILQQNDRNSDNEHDTISLSSSNTSTYSGDDYLHNFTTDKNYELSKNIPSKSTLLSQKQQQYLSVKRYQQQPKSNSKINSKSIDSTIAGVSNLKNYVPPLPYFKSPILSAENIKINKPKLQINFNEKKLKHYNQNNDNNFIGKLKKLNISSKYPALNNNKDEIDYTSMPTTSKNCSNQFHTKSPQYNTINQQQETLTPRDNYQLGIISTSFNESEDELPTNWTNIPDQTIGIPTISSNESFEFKSISSPINFQLSHLTTNNEITSNGIEMNSTIDNNLKSIDFKLNKHSTTNNNNNSNNNLLLKNNSPELENIYSTKYHQYPLVLGNIPSTSISNSINIGIDVLLKNRKPSGSILSNSSSNGMSSGSSLGGFRDIQLNDQPNGNNNLCKKDSGIGGEKNKVKFSDTVQVAVVPEIPRKEKPKQSKRNGFLDSKKELADSLPLCHPHGEYLKDFNPLPENRTTLINNNNNTEQMTEMNNSSNNISNNNSNNSNNDNNNNPSSSIIKVVHFGVV